MNVVDMYKDNAKHLLEVYGDDMPDFIKNAALLEPSDLSGLPDSSFAYVSTNERAYPLVDRGHVATSVMYFMDGLHDIPENELQKVASTLVTACERFELNPPGELQILAEYGPGEEKIASENAPTVDNFYQSARHFAEKYTDYEPSNRRAISLELVKTASMVGELDSLPDIIYKYASDSWNPNLHHELEVRRYLVKAAQAPELIEFIDRLENVAYMTDPDDFAYTLYEFDKTAELLPYYDARISDAYGATFGEPEGWSEEEEAAFELQKFASTDYAQQVLDPDLLNALYNDPINTFDNLPEVYQDAVLSALADYQELSEE